MGILLVVFGHAWRGVEASGLSIPPALFHAVDNAIYAFHMPLFFFLSGLVFQWSGRRGSLRSFATARATRLIWPLALWTWIFFGVKLAAGDVQNGAVSLEDFPLFPLPPFEHFWFLWALFILHLGVGAVFCALPNSAGDKGTRRLTGFVCVLSFAAIGAMPYAGPLLQPAVLHLPFFLAGIALSRSARIKVPRPVAVLSGVLALGLIWLAVPGAVRPVHAFAIVVTLCVCVAGMLQGRPGTLFALGQASLAIYVMHTIFSAGLREFLLAAGAVNVSLHLLAGTVVGLLFPWLVYRAVRGQRAQVALGL